MQSKWSIVKSWGFEPSKVGGEDALIRKAPKGFTEVWDPEVEDYITFLDASGRVSHHYKLDWSLFTLKAEA